MKKIISLMAVLVLGSLLLTGCGQKSNNQVNGGSVDSGNVSQDAQQSSQEDFSGSLNDLIKRGLPTKCVFSYSEEGISQEGETYISGEQARVNTKMSTEDGDVEIYVIKKGTEYYMWGSEMAGKGTKFVFTEADEEELQEKGQALEANKNVDFNKKVDYKCGAWLPDNSLFAVPADIEFQDMTELFKDMIDQSDQIMQEVCQMCNNLPVGEGRDNCIEANCH